MKKNTLADILLFVSLALIVTGVAIISLPWAFIVGGVGLAVMAIWIGRSST